MDGASCFVFDGTRDFCLWRARVESELISRGLLGFVLVRGYNGTQAFAYKGKQMQPKPHEALSDTEALEKENEAITCLRRFLHPTVEAQIANRNAYECWATLYALYGSGKTTDINDMYRALTRTWFGEKKDETMDRFVTRWKMMVQQFEQATGAEQADSVKSAMFVDTLPASWRPLVTNWQGARPITPYAELLDKVSVEAKRRNTESLAESGRSRPTSSSHAPPERGEQPNGADKCFYCFRSNHWYRQCKYLLGDIEKGKTHSQSAYSCTVTQERTPHMVEILEAFVAERTTNSAHEPSADRKRGREDDRGRGEYGRRSQSRPAFQRSQSVARRRSPSRGGRPGLSQNGFREEARSGSVYRGNPQERSRSVYRDDRPERSQSVHRYDRARRSQSAYRSEQAWRSRSSARGESSFSFPPRDDQRGRSFERRLALK